MLEESRFNVSKYVVEYFFGLISIVLMVGVVIIPVTFFGIFKSLEDVADSCKTSHRVVIHGELFECKALERRNVQ